MAGVAALFLAGAVLGWWSPVACAGQEAAGGGAKAPSPREVDALVAAVLGAERRTEAGWQEAAEALARLDLVGPLAAREAASRRTSLLREVRRGGRRLERSGRNWFWEDRAGRERRGLYIVGGQTRRPAGLFLGLHGGGEGAGEAGSAHSAYDGAVRRMGWVGLYPEVLEKTRHGWTDSGTEEFLLELVEAALRTWPVEPDRVFLGGHSMGGYGAWVVGARHADRFAALMPAAGGPTPVMDQTGTIVDVIEGVVPNLRNVPMLIFQSTDDPQVLPGANQMAVKLLEQARERWGGFPFRYWEVHDRGHGFPEEGVGALLEPFRDTVRDAHPERVVWQPVLPWKRQFYWLWMDPVTTGVVIQADLDREGNAVEIRTDRPVPGLHVLLDERLADLEKPVVVRVNGEEVFRGAPARTLGAVLRTVLTGDAALAFTSMVPAAPGGG